MEILNAGNYTDMYESAYISRNKKTETDKNGDIKKEVSAESNRAYVKKLQREVSYVDLEIGSSLNMKRDKKTGTVTINPELLEKMKKDPEAEKKYTQLIKDIERAEKTAMAYYNSLGGCAERTSHWYIDENGKYCHCGYVRRDDKLNKKLHKEAKKNTDEWIEKTRKKSREKAKELKEKLEEKLEEKPEGPAEKREEKIEDPVKDKMNHKVENLLGEKAAAGVNVDLKI